MGLLAASGGHRVPVESVVPGLGRAVEDAALSLVHELLKRLVLVGGALYERVELGDVALVMLAVVKLNGLLRDVGSEGVLGPGELGERVRHAAWRRARAKQEFVTSACWCVEFWRSFGLCKFPQARFVPSTCAELAGGWRSVWCDTHRTAPHNTHGYGAQTPPVPADRALMTPSNALRQSPQRVHRASSPVRLQAPRARLRRLLRRLLRGPLRRCYQRRRRAARSVDRIVNTLSRFRRSWPLRPPLRLARL